MRTVPLEWQTTRSCPPQRSPRVRRNVKNPRPPSPCPASPPAERTVQILSSLFLLLGQGPSGTKTCNTHFAPPTLSTFISVTVTHQLDEGTRTLFALDRTRGEFLSNVAAV